MVGIFAIPVNTIFPKRNISMEIAQQIMSIPVLQCLVTLSTSQYLNFIRLQGQSLSYFCESVHYVILSY